MYVFMWYVLFCVFVWTSSLEASQGGKNCCKLMAGREEKHRGGMTMRTKKYTVISLVKCWRWTFDRVLHLTSCATNFKHLVWCLVLNTFSWVSPVEGKLKKIDSSITLTHTQTASLFLRSVSIIWSVLWLAGWSGEPTHMLAKRDQFRLHWQLIFLYMKLIRSEHARLECRNEICSFYCQRLLAAWDRSYWTSPCPHSSLTGHTGQCKTTLALFHRRY